ncbi:nitroreductase family protein [Sphingobium sp.]|uniref:nitroreductase family protein n=1 Tax=Sphingobium sp. TaxID=1912891 RepID=UPI0028BD888E|nr:nitroreductase family protein [Sphingobium sp.]
MTKRTSDTAISPLFLERWSPRAFDGSAMPREDMRTILDAAHWAPSCFNYQPWRFVYAHRDDEAWDRFINLLIPFNQSWAKNASVLVFIFSETIMGSPEKPSHSHSFDAGAAWAQMGLQALMLGYHSHGMVGIEFDRIPLELNMPEGFRIEAAVAIGRIADATDLPEKLREREKPSGRKPIEEIAFLHCFPHN